MEEWSDETFKAIMDSAERKCRFARLTNQELAGAILELWRETPLMTVRSDLLDEVADRLSVWSEDPAEIHARIEVAIDEASKEFNSPDSTRKDSHEPGA